MLEWGDCLCGRPRHSCEGTYLAHDDEDWRALALHQSCVPMLHSRGDHRRNRREKSHLRVRQYYEKRIFAARFSVSGFSSFPGAGAFPPRLPGRVSDASRTRRFFPCASPACPPGRFAQGIGLSAPLRRSFPHPALNALAASGARNRREIKLFQNHPMVNLMSRGDEAHRARRHLLLAGHTAS
jgi:hypothetical protein